MMVDGAEEGQLKGPIDFLAPYTFKEALSLVIPAQSSCRHSICPGPSAPLTPERR
jgi:hypothetical protein